MTDFITVTNDGEHITSRMPPDETVVLVMLIDGTVRRAWYSCNLMEAGDWDFVPVLDDDEPDMEADSLADQVTAWRPAVTAGERGNG